jgi:hypothetical protein
MKNYFKVDNNKLFNVVMLKDNWKEGKNLQILKSQCSKHRSMQAGSHQQKRREGK